MREKRKKEVLKERKRERGEKKSKEEERDTREITERGEWSPVWSGGEKW